MKRTLVSAFELIERQNIYNSARNPVVCIYEWKYVACKLYNRFIRGSLSELQKLLQLLLLFKSDVRSFLLTFFLNDSIFEDPFNLLSSFDHRWVPWYPRECFP